MYLLHNLQPDQFKSFYLVVEHSFQVFNLSSLGSQNWQVYLNLLSPESDQNQSSPSNINAQSIRVWSYEKKRTWSPKMNSLDTLTTSSHYFYRKCMLAGKENLNFVTSWARGLRDLYLFIYWAPLPCENGCFTK